MGDMNVRIRTYSVASKHSMLFQYMDGGQVSVCNIVWEWKTNIMQYADFNQHR